MDPDDYVRALRRWRVKSSAVDQIQSEFDNPTPSLCYARTTTFDIGFVFALIAQSVEPTTTTEALLDFYSPEYLRGYDSLGRSASQLEATLSIANQTLRLATHEAYRLRPHGIEIAESDPGRSGPNDSFNLPTCQLKIAGGHIYLAVRAAPVESWDWLHIEMVFWSNVHHLCAALSGLIGATFTYSADRGMSFDSSLGNPEDADARLTALPVVEASEAVSTLREIATLEESLRVCTLAGDRGGVIASILKRRSRYSAVAATYLGNHALQTGGWLAADI